MTHTTTMKTWFPRFSYYLVFEMFRETSVLTLNPEPTTDSGLPASTDESLFHINSHNVSGCL